MANELMSINVTARNYFEIEPLIKWRGKLVLLKR
jgi:hypothetical protein